MSDCSDWLHPGSQVLQCTFSIKLIHTLAICWWSVIVFSGRRWFFYTPLFLPCLENPRDGGAWWAAVYGITRNRTQLKWLSSSSSFFLKFFWFLLPQMHLILLLQVMFIWLSLHICYRLFMLFSTPIMYFFLVAIINHLRRYVFFFSLSISVWCHFPFPGILWVILFWIIIMVHSY